MKFIEFNDRINKTSNPKIQKKCIFFNALAEELDGREIPDEVLGSINTHLEEINSYEGVDKGLLKAIRKEQTAILRLVEKELKLVCRNHYRNTWIAIGMLVFGIPLG